MVSVFRLGRCLALLACLVLPCVLAPQANADNAFGGLYVTGASTAQALSTSAAKVTAFTTLLPSSTADGELSIVGSVADDNVAVVPGVYKITATITGTCGATTAITYSLRDGATAITGATSTVNYPASTGVTTSIDFFYRPTAAGAISVYALAASGTPSITPTDATLNIVRLK